MLNCTGDLKMSKSLRDLQGFSNYIKNNGKGEPFENKESE